MSGWWIAAIVGCGWAVVSVLAGVVVGHLMAAKPLRLPRTLETAGPTLVGPVLVGPTDRSVRDEALSEQVTA